jgi:hypothetical protein
MSTRNDDRGREHPHWVFDDLEALLVGVLPCAETFDAVCVLVPTDVAQAGDGPASGASEMAFNFATP